MKAGLTRTLGVTIVHPSTFRVTGRLTTRMMKHPPNQNSSSSHSMNNKRARCSVQLQGTGWRRFTAWR